MRLKGSCSPKGSCPFTRKVQDTIDALQNGEITWEDIPRVCVIRRPSDGRLLTMNHRRLYCFQKALPTSAEVEVELLISSWAMPRRGALDLNKAWKAVRVEDKNSFDRFPEKEVRI